MRAVASKPLDVLALEVADGDQVPPLGRLRRERLPHDAKVGIVALLGAGDEQDAVDLVGLDELHLHPLAARGRQVLADVVGPDRKLAVAAVGEDGELDAPGPPVLEERLDRGPDRPARVEDVVDEDAGSPLERELELGRADERLGAAALSPPRTPTSSRWNVMSTAPTGSSTPARSSTRRRSRWASGTPRVWMPTSATSSSSGFRLDDLVRDARERPCDRDFVEEVFPSTTAGALRACARVAACACGRASSATPFGPRPG